MKISLLLLGLGAMLSGQEFRGTIVGRITDPSGAAVPGVSAEAVNVQTNVLLKAVSNEAGNYQIPFLLPGDYLVKVSHAGFKTLERPGIRISTNETLTINFNLEIGATSESVTVTAATPLLDTANADLGHVIEKRYLDLPTIGRNVMNAWAFAPGVTGGGGTYTSVAQNNFSIAGGGSGRGKSEILIDGIPNTLVGGDVSFVPSVDSTEEVKVHTTMFDASLGHSNAGALSMTTRSGGNQLHGATYFYKSYRALGANSWTNNRLGLGRPPVNYHQWGFVVSGPVRLPRLYEGRNRTFFTASLERDHNPRELTQQWRMPTEAERQGDFSATLNRRGGPLTIYDPSTTIVEGNRVTRQPFPGNRIPADRISPIGRAVLNEFPLPNLGGTPQIGAFNWALSKTYTVDQRLMSGRLDHMLSERHRMFGRIGRVNRHQDSDDLYAANIGADHGHSVRHFWNFGLDDTVTFSPVMVASFRVGVVRYSSPATTGAAGLDPARLNLPDLLIRNQAFRGWPTFNLGENIGPFGSSSSFNSNTVHTFNSTTTKLTGGHSTKFGADYRLGRINNNGPGGSAAGSFTATAAFTQSDPFNLSTADTTGTSMASLLLGAPASGSFGSNSAYSFQNHYFAWFVQNDWKVTRRLTINLGLRHELETPYTERFDRMTYSFDEVAKLPVQARGLDLRGGILFSGVAGNPRTGGRVDGNNFGPRVGLALQITPKTVIRTGYGLFYSVQSNNSGFRGELGVFNAVTDFAGTIDGGATIYNTLSNPFPDGLRAPVGSSTGLMAQVGDSLTFFDLNRVNPYNQQWQLSIQRELPGRIVLETAYMGMLNIKQFESFNLNEKPDQYLALGRAENNSVPNPFLGVLPPTSSLGRGATITQRQLWTRFPQFTSIIIDGANTGRAIYHSLQTRLEKRLSHGLNFIWNYTWSRLIDNNTTSLINERHYRAVSGFDQKHVSRVAFTYDLPFSFAGNRFLKQAAGGWQLAGSITMLTGTPLSVSHINGRPIRIRNPKLSGSVHDRLGDRRDASGRVLNPYFDTDAFAPLPDQFTITPEPPFLDELRAPGTFSMAGTLSKSFPIRERLKLETMLRADNITNTPIFGAPGTNMNNAATFGVITSAGGNRAMQAVLRLVF